MGDGIVDLEFDDPVVLKLFERMVCNQEVADRFKAFFSKHRHKFEDCSIDAEQKLEYTDVFREYSELYDDILGDIVTETGCDREEIADRCKKGLAGGGVDAFFLDAIIAASSASRVANDFGPCASDDRTFT